MDNKDLRSLFGDDTLTPQRQFERRLRRQLDGSDRTRRRWLPLTGLAASGLLAVAAIIGLSVMPTHQSSSSTDTAIHDLYGRAVAAQQFAAGGKATFWRIDRTQTYGPAAPSCAAYDPQGYQPEHRTTLVYDDHHTSAMVSKSNRYRLVQNYSADPRVNTGDIAQFQSGNDIALTGLLAQATLTDKDGQPLKAGLQAQLAGTSQYDIYAKVTPAAGSKDYSATCPTIAIHAVIDTRSDTFSSIRLYRSAISDANLTTAVTQTLSSASTSFSAVKPQFIALGFDQAAADLANRNLDYATVTNQAAGYLFSYRPSIYGDMHTDTLKDSSGAVAGWRYTFTAQPSITFVVHTSNKATDHYPKTVADLRRMAVVGGWAITNEITQDQGRPGYGPLPTHSLYATGAGLRYGLSEYQRPDGSFVSSYFEASDSLTAITRPNKDAPNYPITDDPLTDISLVTLFVPGGNFNTMR